MLNLRLGTHCQAVDPCGVFDLCIDTIDNCYKNHICLSNVFYTSPTKKEFEEHCIFRPPTYYGLGCYKAKGRNHTVFGKLLYNLRTTLNWLKMSETVEKCATLVANYHGGNPRQYFAIRFYGECWTYDNPDDLRYDIFGKAYDCYRGNGGSSSNYVYQFASSAVNVTELASRSIRPRDQDEEPPAYYGLGCYKANSHRFQRIVANLVSFIDWRNMTKTVHDCAKRVWNIWDNISQKYFVIRRYGECYSEDNTIASHYYDDEKATDCFMGTGSHVSNYIYYFGPSSEKTATMTYTALGCYGLVPQVNHVIATYGLPRDGTASSNKIKIIELCAKEAWKRGNKFFGINNDVRCVSGPSTYLPAGLTVVSEASDACLDGLGRNGTTFVYKFND